MGVINRFSIVDTGSSFNKNPKGDDLLTVIILIICILAIILVVSKFW